jgi:hypothetical protein
LPSCQSPSKNVTVFDQLTDRLIESSSCRPYCLPGGAFVTMIAAKGGADD